MDAVGMSVILTGARRGASARPVYCVNCTLEPKLPGEYGDDQNHSQIWKGGGATQ